MRSSAGTRARRFACVALTIVVGCAPLPTRDLRASRSEMAEVALHPTGLPSGTALSAPNRTAEQRAATLDRIWRTIEDLYYDPAYNGVDVAALRAKSIGESSAVRSDAEWYRLLKRSVRAMHDSHTLILTPREAEDARTFRATQIGVVFAISEDRVVVDIVHEGFPAAQAGFRPGMIVEAIDGQPIDEAFFDRVGAAPPDPVGTEPFGLGNADADRALRLRAVRALLVAAAGPPSPHRLTLRRADDTLLQADVEARGGELPTRESYVLRPTGIGVLKLSRFDSVVRARLAHDIDAARDHSHGLIIDLRGNPGGEQRLFQWLVGRFVPRRVELAETIERAGSRTTTGSIDADPADRPYTRPIAVLIDRSTGSASELTAHALVEQRDAIAVGEATCGCVVAIRRDYVLPDGGALRVSQVGYRTAKGRRMEADPLRPAIEVKPSLAQRRAGEDVVLEAAERALLTR